MIAGLASWEYLPGRPAAVWAYRDGNQPAAEGTVPGPVLRAHVGDHVVVHFRNELTEETTVHRHGIRVPTASDGTTAAQVPVPPGGTFDYEFDALDAGTFWYHPHMRADVQIENGLYGMVVIEGTEQIDVAADRAFVLDDVKLEADGELSQRIDSLDAAAAIDPTGVAQLIWCALQAGLLAP